MSEQFADKSLFIEENREQLCAIVTLSSSLADAAYDYSLDWANGRWVADPAEAQPLHDDADDLVLDALEAIYETRFPRTGHNVLPGAGAEMDEVKVAHITHRQLFETDKIGEIRAECFKIQTSGKYGITPFSVTGVEISRENMHVADTLLIAQADDDLAVDYSRMPVEDGDLFKRVVGRTEGYAGVRDTCMDAMTGDLESMADLEQFVRNGLGNRPKWVELLDEVRLRHHTVLAETGPMPPWYRPTPVILEKAASVLVNLVAGQA